MKFTEERLGQAIIERLEQKTCSHVIGRNIAHFIGLTGDTALGIQNND